MTKKWNLQDIRPAEPKKQRAPISTEPAKEETPVRQEPVEREHIPNIVIEDGTKKGNGRLAVSVVLFVLIIGVAIGLSAMLGKTELTISPINKQPNVSAEFTAYPAKKPDSLSYEILTLEATGEDQVKASGQVEITKQATGMIVIMKSTPGAERLIKNTRFRSPDGLVFRIQESVVVPGSVTDSDGNSVPGNIQAQVFADEAGAEYNLPSGTTFDVPGFDEGGYTELFNSISAKNQDPFIDGFSGPQFQIDQAELQTSRQALQIELRNNLLEQIEAKKPAGFIAFPQAVAMTYTELPAVEYGSDLVTIKEQAILQIALFDEVEFGSFIAKETIPTYDGTDVKVRDPLSLTFQYTKSTTSASIIANETSLTFRLTGKPLLVWQYDAELLTQNLAGLPKTAISNAISAYPGIKEAKVHITPFWQRTFPESAEEIVIIEVLREGE